MSISKSIKDLVWNTYNGKVYSSFCYVGCGKKISVQNFICGHVHPKSKGGDVNIENLRPICLTCNSSMSNKHMLDFVLDCGFQSNLLNELSQNNIYQDNIVDILDESQNSITKYFFEQNKHNLIISYNLIYIFDEITKLWIKSSNNQFIHYISNYLSHEIKKLIKEEDNIKILLNYKKALNSYTDIKYIECLGRQIKEIFENNNYWEKLDDCKYEINFKNGVYDLREGSFRERKREDYVTKCLNINYTDTINENINNEINKMILHISNDNVELKEFNLSWFGYCLTGETKEKKMLFVIGSSAQNGKSSLGRMFMYSLPIYSTEIDNKSFNKGYSNIYKQLYGVNKPIRFVIIEELSKNKLDYSLFQKFVDGNEILKDNKEKIIVQGKLYITSNNDLRFITDSSMAKIGLEEILTNKFLPIDEYNQCKDKTGIYQKDIEFENKFQYNDDYKMEFIRILLTYAKKYYLSGLFIPNIIKKNYKELYEENNSFKDFINNYYITTNSDKDRIHKDDLVELYNTTNKKKINWTHLMSDVKRIGLIYDRDKREFGSKKKGVIMGIKRKDCDQADDTEEKPKTLI